MMEVNSFGPNKVSSSHVEGLCNKESNKEITALLDSANLLQYLPTFIQQGGDDINQLCDASQAEFNDIVEILGMSSKPLHVKRLVKALSQWKFASVSRESQECTRPSLLESYPQPMSSVCSPSCLTGGGNERLTSGSFEIRGGVTAGEKENAVASQVCYYGKPPAAEHSPSFTIPDDIPYLLNLQNLDEERYKIIKQTAQIYGKDDSKRQRKITRTEELINEVSMQLCLRDPTFLVKRDALFTLARKIVKNSKTSNDPNLSRPGPSTSRPEPTADHDHGQNGKGDTDPSLPPLIKIQEDEISCIDYTNKDNQDCVPTSTINKFDWTYDVIKFYKIHKCWPKGVIKERKSLLRRQASKIHLIDDALYKGDIHDKCSRLWLNNPIDIKKAIATHHISKGGKHYGSKRTVARISSLYYWKGIGKDVDRYIQLCSICRLQSNLKSNDSVTEQPQTKETILPENQCNLYS